MSFDPTRRIDELIEAIERYNRAYYSDGVSLIADAEYDTLYRELEQLEAEYPLFQRNDSPTKRVGAKVNGNVPPIEHGVPMLSLGNAYTLAEVTDFMQKVWQHDEQATFSVEPKIDGVAVTLQYVQGEFSLGATRGDGKFGEDITHTLKTIRLLPLAIDTHWAECEIRGEVYIRREHFKQINQQRAAAGEPLYANPRNLAAGTLKLLDPALAAPRHLNIFTYALYGAPLTTQQEALKQLKKLGFPVNPLSCVCRNADEVFAAIQAIATARFTLPYDIDGAVIKVNEFSLHQALGTTAKTPRYALAYKYEATQASTRLQAITWQVGRTGVLTPVAELEPVLLAGSTIARATLHNLEELSRKDIRVGDMVFLEKGGDVIPKIVAPIIQQRTGMEVAVIPPECCPVCSGKIAKSDDLVALYCVNQQCPARVKGTIAHFASRDAMDIEGLGERAVERFWDTGMIRSISDIYTADLSEIAQLDGYGAKSVANLEEAIERSKQRSLSRLLFALGIRHVGKKTAEVLAERYRTLEALLNATLEELIGLPDIGEKVATEITAYLALDDTRNLIYKLIAAGVQPPVTPQHDMTLAVTTPLTGKTVLFTGTLSLPRRELEEMVRQHGGVIAGSVNRKLDYLVCGEKPGSKREKALELQITILDEEEFLTLCGKK
ncbi:NAD-dependent DNA ligase LigA [Chrysiogenes arsenatis]|uniref:NAD-dependent DNA ligase LigA n=1 Tax=Chrysiogenes arsenatis TaxID=309797 RepID=UPI00048441F8|nr:NAD-dependent DNA ligase LigA [Chrysiogenes arsenatis]